MGLMGLIWKWRVEKGHYQVVGVSPHTGDIKEYGRFFTRKAPVERHVNWLNRKEREREARAVPHVTTCKETAYGSTTTLSFGIRVF